MIDEVLSNFINGEKSKKDALDDKLIIMNEKIVPLNEASKDNITTIVKNVNSLRSEWKSKRLNSSEEISEKIDDVNSSNNISNFGTSKMSSMSDDNPRGNIHFLNIIGQIEGHIIAPPTSKTTKYEHVIPQLVAIAENRNIDGMLILLNTVGGDVEAGLAIAELISKLGKPTVSLVIGGGHSIGVPLAVSADYSFIAPSATMTIHPVRVNGTVIGAPQTYDYFNKMQERVLGFVTENSKISSDRLKNLMLETNKLMLDVGTMLIGQEAVNEKIIDEVGGLSDAIEKLYSIIEVYKNN